MPEQKVLAETERKLSEMQKEIERLERIRDRSEVRNKINETVMILCDHCQETKNSATAIAIAELSKTMRL